MFPRPRYDPRVAKQQTDRVTHFGQFVRWHRVNAGKTADRYAADLGLTGRRVIAIEAMAEPAVQHRTLAALARSMDLTMEELDRAWRTTPVPRTQRRSGPTTDAAHRFAAACAAVGTTPPEGIRRLRRWLIDQPPAVQRAALSGAPVGTAPAPRFTAPVDHLQDPASAQAGRVAARAQQRPAARPKTPGGRPAASPATPPGPAATGGSRRR